MSVFSLINIFSKDCFIYLGIHRMQYSCPHLRQWVETPVADESNSRLHTLQCLLSLQFTQSTATESSSNSALSCAKMKKKETLNCIYSQTINFSLIHYWDGIVFSQLIYITYQLHVSWYFHSRRTFRCLWRCHGNGWRSIVLCIIITRTFAMILTWKFWVARRFRGAMTYFDVFYAFFRDCWRLIKWPRVRYKRLPKLENF